MAYRLLREFRQASTRLDTPPFSNRRHPFSGIAPAAKDQIITVTAAQENVSREQAAQRFNEAIQTAKAAADKSAAAASMGSFLGVVALLLGAIAAAVGGMFAIHRRSVVTMDRHVVN